MGYRADANTLILGVDYAAFSRVRIFRNLDHTTPVIVLTPEANKRFPNHESTQFYLTSINTLARKGEDIANLPWFESFKYIARNSETFNLRAVYYAAWYLYKYYSQKVDFRLISADHRFVCQKVHKFRELMSRQFRLEVYAMVVDFQNRYGRFADADKIEFPGTLEQR